MQLIHNKLFNVADNAKTMTAIITGGSSIKFNDLMLRIKSISDFLILQGLTRGDKVLIILDNDIDLLSSIYALMRSCGIAVPYSKILSVEEIKKDLNFIQPDLILTNEKNVLNKTILPDLTGCPIYSIETALELQEHHHDNLNHSNAISKLMEIDEKDLIFYLQIRSSDNLIKQTSFSHSDFLFEIEKEHLASTSSGRNNNIISFADNLHNGFIKTTAALLRGETVVIRNNKFSQKNLVQLTKDKDVVYNSSNN